MTIYIETLSPHPIYGNLHCHIVYGPDGRERYKAWGDSRAHADYCLAAMVEVEDPGATQINLPKGEVSPV